MTAESDWETLTVRVPPFSAAEWDSLLDDRSQNPVVWKLLRCIHIAHRIAEEAHPGSAQEA